jgi:hypothetical protein
VLGAAANAVVVHADPVQCSAKIFVNAPFSAVFPTPMQLEEVRGQEMDVNPLVDDGARGFKFSHPGVEAVAGLAPYPLARMIAPVAANAAHRLLSFGISPNPFVSTRS